VLIFSPAQRPIVTGAHFDADPLVKNIALHLGGRLQHHAAAADRARHLALNGHFLVGDNATVHAPVRCDNERRAIDVALDDPIKRNAARGRYIADDCQVVADIRIARGMHAQVWRDGLEIGLLGKGKRSRH